MVFCSNFFAFDLAFLRIKKKSLAVPKSKMHKQKQNKYTMDINKNTVIVVSARTCFHQSIHRTQRFALSKENLLMIYSSRDVSFVSIK